MSRHPAQPSPSHILGSIVGEFGERVREHEWDATYLGPTESWPAALGYSAALVFNARQPMAIFWGPDCALIYNAAWAELDFGGDLDGLGRPAHEVYDGTWRHLEESIRRVRCAERSSAETASSSIQHNEDGKAPALSGCTLNPVAGDDGRTCGVLAVSQPRTAITDKEAVVSQKSSSPSVCADRKDAQTLAALLEHIPMGITIAFGPGLEIRHVSRRGQEMISLSPEGFEGLTLPQHNDHVDVRQADGVTPAPVEDWPLARAVRDGITIEGEVLVIVRPDGRRVPLLCNAAPILDERGIVTGGVVGYQDISEQKRIEEALRNSEETLSAVLDALPTGIVIADADGRIVRHNAAARDIWGDVPETSSWKDYDRWVAWWPETGKRIEAEDWGLSRALLHGEIMRSQLIKYRRFGTGEQRYYLNSAAPLRGADGRVAGGVSAMLDVTDRLAVENALRESEEQWRAMFEVASVGIVQVDPADGQFIRCNETYCRITGYTQEELRQRAFRELTHPEDREEDWRLFSRAVRGETPTYLNEKRYIRKNGEVIWVRVNAAFIHDEDGRPVRTAAICEEITERKRSEHNLRRSEHRFRTMADNAPAMLWLTNAKHNCTFLNRGWTEFTGQPAEDGLGFGWLNVIHPDDRERCKEEFIEAAVKQSLFKTDMRLRTVDGDYRWTIDIGHPRFSDKGRFLGYIGSVLDIHERKQYEEHMRTVMAELNHRVKNTLATVDAIAQNTVSQTGSVEEFLQSFGPRLRSMAAAHSLLTRAKWHGATIRDILLTELSPRVRDAASLELRGPEVLMKPKAALGLHMAIHELATNACKYGSLSVPDGRIVVGWSVHQHGGADQLEITWREAGGPPATPPERSGFGSQLINDIADYELGGRVDCSFESTGLECRIQFPLTDTGFFETSSPAVGLGEQLAKSSEYVLRPEAPDQPSSAMPVVLVVEDNATVARTLCNTLEGYGVAVVGPARNLATATELAESVKYDAALLDVDLNGVRVDPLARRLRQQQTPFAFITGYGVEQLAEDLRDCSVITKPVAPDAILAWLQRVASKS